MDYTIEQFNLDMRKINLYSETAYSEYAFAIEETFMDESVDDYDVDIIVTEAGETLFSKIKAVFAKIIESVKKFFANLIEKIKNFFASNKEDKLKKAIQKNPELAKKKVEVPDLKEIEDICGKRAILRKKMIAEYKKGTLTRDKFNKMKEDSDKLAKRLKVVGVVTVAVGTIAAGAFTFSKLHSKVKNDENDIVKDITQVETTDLRNSPIHQPCVAKHVDPRNSDKDSRIEDAIREQEAGRRDFQPPAAISGTEVASTVAQDSVQDERAILIAEIESAKKAMREANIESREAERKKDIYTNTAKDNQDAIEQVEKQMRDISKVRDLTVEEMDHFSTVLRKLKRDKELNLYLAKDKKRDESHAYMRWSNANSRYGMAKGKLMSLDGKL